MNWPRYVYPAGIVGLSSSGVGPVAFSVISAAISAIRASLGTNGDSRNIRPNRPSNCCETGRYASPRIS
jgi:hypothetical protein